MTIEQTAKLDVPELTTSNSTNPTNFENAIARAFYERAMALYRENRLDKLHAHWLHATIEEYVMSDEGDEIRKKIEDDILDGYDDEIKRKVEEAVAEKFKDVMAEEYQKFLAELKETADKAGGQ